MIVLNADDYAMGADIDGAITSLTDAGRLSATSIMTNMPQWPATADAVAKRRSHLALGLHLNLTEGTPLSEAARQALTGASHEFRPLRDLLVHALLGRLHPAVIAAEVRAQLDAFEAALGYLPDFIDGHQHVHVLPGVRDGLFAALRELDWPAPPLVRTPTNQATGPRDPLSAMPKRAIAGLLAAVFRARLTREGLPTNDTFAGFSTFHPGSTATDELTRALNADGNGLHLVMCHPATSTSATTPSDDPLAQRRIDEFRALMAMPNLPKRIWHPTRESNGTIDWTRRIKSAGTSPAPSTRDDRTGEVRSS